MKGGAEPIDVVIATYNRPDSVARLVDELRGCTPEPAMIVVVDSSDDPNRRLQDVEGVCYIRAGHKNQPYQRYVGLLACQASVVVMLDDDLFIEKKDIFDRYLSFLHQMQVVGVTLGVDYQTAIAPVFGLPSKGIGRFLLGLWSRIRHSMTPGRIGLGGRTGGFPNRDAIVEFFPGPNMCFRRDVALKLFDETLFALFERKLAMGEDKAISMRANRFGKLFRGAENCFRHPPALRSTYEAPPEEFVVKVLVSRLYLSRVYCEVFGVPPWVGHLHYPTILIRVLLSGLARGKIESRTALRAIKKSLMIIRETKLSAVHLTHGVDYWVDAIQDVERSCRGVSP